MKTRPLQIFGFLIAAIVLAACGTSSPTAAPSATTKAAPTQALPISTEPPIQTAAPTEVPAVVGEVAGVEGGGGEAPLVTYADTAQGFSIDYPKPWTQDPTVKDGIKFMGDGTMTLAFIKTDVKDVLTFATTDAKTFAASLSSFKQVGLAASTEVKNAVVLAFETTGTSNVTGKTYAARGDRYYIGLKDGRIAVLTVISPVKNYDREGVRDIALTLKVTK